MVSSQASAAIDDISEGDPGKHIIVQVFWQFVRIMIDACGFPKRMSSTWRPSGDTFTSCDACSDSIATLWCFSMRCRTTIAGYVAEWGSHRYVDTFV